MSATIDDDTRRLALENAIANLLDAQDEIRLAIQLFERIARTDIDARVLGLMCQAGRKLRRSHEAMIRLHPDGRPRQAGAELRIVGQR